MKRDGQYSYKDYLTWPDEERWEIIDGTAYNMSPALTLKHQDIGLEKRDQVLGCDFPIFSFKINKLVKLDIGNKKYAELYHEEVF